MPRVSFSRCGLLLLTSGGGVSSMARVPVPRAAAALVEGRADGRRAGPRLSASAVGFTACREL